MEWPARTGRQAASAVAGAPAGILCRVRWLGERLQATDYCTVGRSRRFRARQRRRFWASARITMLVIAAAYVFDLVTTADHGSVVAALDIGLIGLALAGRWSLARRARHHPELVVWVVTSGVIFTMAATAVAVPDLAVQTAGYLFILPGLLALLLPWRTRTHLTWLGAYLVITLGYLALVGNEALTPHVREDLVTVLAVASGSSLAGQVLLHLAHVRTFAQQERLRALRRQRDAYNQQLDRTHGELTALQATARELAARSLQDPLTGLANRTLLHDRLAQALAQRGTTVAVVMLDLDGFKAVNDRLGHAAGDAVLVGAARRFASVLRSGDTLARLGGDEFAVVAPAVTDDAMAGAIADRLLRSLDAPATVDVAGREAGEVVVHASAGLALAEAGTCEAQELLRRADVAMYHAKEGGRHRWALFDVAAAAGLRRQAGRPTGRAVRHR